MSARKVLIGVLFQKTTRLLRSVRSSFPECIMTMKSPVKSGCKEGSVMVAFTAIYDKIDLSTLIFVYKVHRKSDQGKN